MGETQLLPISDTSMSSGFEESICFFRALISSTLLSYKEPTFKQCFFLLHQTTYLKKSALQMAHVTLSDGLAIWQLVYYVVTLICSIFVSFRHGLARSSGWIFLTIFSIIRVVGCSAQIATITATSDTAETIATILGFLGLSPLLLATLGILSRV